MTRLALLLLLLPACGGPEFLTGPDGLTDGDAATIQLPPLDAVTPDGGSPETSTATPETSATQPDAGSPDVPDGSTTAPDGPVSCVAECSDTACTKPPGIGPPGFGCCTTCLTDGCNRYCGTWQYIVPGSIAATTQTQDCAQCPDSSQIACIIPANPAHGASCGCATLGGACEQNPNDCPACGVGQTPCHKNGNCGCATGGPLTCQ